MNQRTMDEMISYFNREVSKMDIKHEDKIKLLGMITAIGYENKKPERKTGRWQRHYSRPNVYADLWWHCSVCGFKNDDQYANRYHNFCPNCGAKMEVES